MELGLFPHTCQYVGHALLMLRAPCHANPTPPPNLVMGEGWGLGLWGATLSSWGSQKGGIPGPKKAVFAARNAPLYAAFDHVQGGPNPTPIRVGMAKL